MNPVPDEKQEAGAAPLVPITLFALVLIGVLVAGALGLALGAVDAQSAPREGRPAALAVEVADADPASSLTTPKRVSAEWTNRCGQSLAEVGPSEADLELTVHFPGEAWASEERVRGMITITNTGTERLTGETWPGPALTLSRDDRVFWHTSGFHLTPTMIIDLAPGESFEYTTTFAPVDCSADPAYGDPESTVELPPVPRGDYELSALLDFHTASGLDLISGPVSTITLR